MKINQTPHYDSSVNTTVVAHLAPKQGQQRLAHLAGR
jgi:hypothetical protein